MENKNIQTFKITNKNLGLFMTSENIFKFNKETLAPFLEKDSEYELIFDIDIAGVNEFQEFQHFYIEFDLKSYDKVKKITIDGVFHYNTIINFLLNPKIELDIKRILTIELIQLPIKILLKGSENINISTLSNVEMIVATGENLNLNILNIIKSALIITTENFDFISNKKGNKNIKINYASNTYIKPLSYTNITFITEIIDVFIKKEENVVVSLKDTCLVKNFKSYLYNYAEKHITQYISYFD